MTISVSVRASLSIRWFGSHYSPSHLLVCCERTQILTLSCWFLVRVALARCLCMRFAIHEFLIRVAVQVTTGECLWVAHVIGLYVYTLTWQTNKHNVFLSPHCLDTAFLSEYIYIYISAHTVSVYGCLFYVVVLWWRPNIVCVLMKWTSFD